MSRRPLLRWLRRAWIIAGLASTAWLGWNVQAHGVPPEDWHSDGRVVVATTAAGFVFTPRTPVTGAPAFVMLPGALVDPRAYVPLVRAIAEGGYPAAVVPLPYRLAPGEPGRAALWARIGRATADWADRSIVLGGHSLGGKLAAGFVASHPGRASGLVLIGTTHPRDESLVAAGIPALKILGSRDCVAPVERARANAARLPADTTWVVIDGGNHAQFASYGWQIGDCRATIARDAQRVAVTHAILGFLSRIARR
jgi:pimeloyl-ACP methyl ester carboxylesterase